MAHRQSFNRTDRPTDRCGDHSDGCRNRLRRYNFQPRPYPSLQRSCALRRVARCSLLGSKTIRRPSGPQRNPLKSLVDEEGLQSSFSGRRTKPQGAGIISGLATIPRNDLIQHSECYGGLTPCKPFFGNTCPHLVAVPFDHGESSGQQFGRPFLVVGLLLPKSRNRRAILVCIWDSWGLAVVKTIVLSGFYFFAMKFSF
jgi:hypothetical protein